jgi:murein DD-endopeptidase MepM/ murein hydrolase activator NlpD
MKGYYLLFTMTWLLFYSAIVHAQIEPVFPIDNNEYTGADAQHPCFTPAQYEAMEQEIVKNRKTLHLEVNVPNNAAPTLLQWPLEPSDKLTDCGYYEISAYVDQNTASGSVLDWNCGARTYDGHRGVDIVPWPFIWNKMDSNLVKVIAAAPGTIIAKVDGNPDRVCDGVGGGSSSNNYITIQHADGSTAVYAHMKTGAFTTKIVGQTVVTGEYLGIVGSAGQSTGVHLHFEIRSDGTFAKYVDPYYGPCNTATSASWWANQKPYEEPMVLKLSLHNSWPYMAVCPNTVDTLYEVDKFISSPGSKASFYVCTRDVAPYAPWSFQILDASNKILDSWTYANNATPRKVSTVGWNRTLPVTPGKYTFQSTFNGITCQKTFTIETVTQLSEVDQYDNSYFYPNPTSGMISCNEPIQHIAIYNSLGQMINAPSTSSKSVSLEEFPDGIYFIKTNKSIFKIVKCH